MKGFNQIGQSKGIPFLESLSLLMCMLVQNLFLDI